MPTNKKQNTTLNKNKNNIPTTHTQIKIIPKHIYHNNTYPLKILGICTFFFGLFYMLFTKSNQIYDYIQNTLNLNNKTKPKNQTEITTHTDKNTTHTDKNTTHTDKNIKQTNPEKNIQHVNKKLTVVKDFVDASQKPKEINQIPLPQNQPTQNTNKTKYCYIGEHKGMRSCTTIQSANECMSGDIFLSEKQCVNPNLRYTPT